MLFVFFTVALALKDPLSNGSDNYREEGVRNILLFYDLPLPLPTVCRLSDHLVR